METLVVTDLEGGYEGKSILKQVSFQVKGGEIVGLIGSNGSGKTTLMKTLLGILPQRGGTIRLDGSDLKEAPHLVQETFAYIPEIPFLYDELTLEEHLEFAAMANGLSQSQYRERAAWLLELFRLTGKEAHFPGSFSKGMKQKIMVMCALMKEAGLLVVDEPFIGLDPKAMKDFTRILREYRDQGKGVLLSTHVLEGAEALCDRFLILSRGALVFEGTLADLRQKTGMEEGSLLDLYDFYVEEGP